MEQEGEREEAEGAGEMFKRGRRSENMTVWGKMPVRRAFCPFIISRPPSPDQAPSVLPLRPPWVCPVPLPVTF